jgi:hypothetical protein
MNPPARESLYSKTYQFVGGSVSEFCELSGEGERQSDARQKSPANVSGWKA